MPRAGFKARSHGGLRNALRRACAACPRRSHRPDRANHSLRQSRYNLPLFAGARQTSPSSIGPNRFRCRRCRQPASALPEPLAHRPVVALHQMQVRRRRIRSVSTSLSRHHASADSNGILLAPSPASAAPAGHDALPRPCPSGCRVLPGSLPAAAYRRCLHFGPQIATLASAWGAASATDAPSQAPQSSARFGSAGSDCHRRCRVRQLQENPGLGLPQTHQTPAYQLEETPRRVS